MANTVVYGIYSSREAIEQAVNRLKSEGFRNSDVSVLFPSSSESQQFSTENTTKAPEGAATGAFSGAALGGVLGWLAGIGSLAIPGVGPFIAAGPIISAIAGVGVGGAVGGLAGSLIGLGIPEYEAKLFEGKIKSGGILMSVHTDSEEWADKAEDILEGTGAQDIGRKSVAGGRTGLSSQVETQVDASSVERRAFEIWQEEGRPAGKEAEHWRRAEQELRARH